MSRNTTLMLRNASLIAAAVCLPWPSALADTVTTTNPYLGVTYITRSQLNPRGLNVNMHITLIDLTAPGISFTVTPHADPALTIRETQRQTTADFLNQQKAQVGINVAFFNPVTTTDTYVYDAGLIMSQGQYVSNFDPQPVSAEFPNTIQNYAIVPYAPALNIDPTNHAGIVHRDASYPDNQHILENATLWNAVSGSAQIITDGTVTVPVYKDATHPDGLLATTSTYSNSNSWYNLTNARTAIGFTQDDHTLVLFTLDNAGGSYGLTVPEVANILQNDYHCYEALNLDGGGSTAMALSNPSTGIASIVNSSSDNPLGRAEGVNFAVFASPVPEPASLALVSLGVMTLLSRRRKTGQA